METAGEQAQSLEQLREELKGSGIELPEQSREQIAEFLKRAFEQGLEVDLVIEQFGSIDMVPVVLVMEMQGENLTVSYIEDDGYLGPEIPVDLDKIKGVILGTPFQSPADLEE